MSWACFFCTFQNTAADNQCQMCSADKPFRDKADDIVQSFFESNNCRGDYADRDRGRGERGGRGGRGERRDRGDRGERRDRGDRGGRGGRGGRGRDMNRGGRGGRGGRGDRGDRGDIGDREDRRGRGEGSERGGRSGRGGRGGRGGGRGGRRMQLQGAVPARTSSALQVDLDMTLDDHENNIKNNGNGDNKSSGSPNSNDDSRGSDDANSAGNGNSAGRFSNREKDQFKFRTYGIDFNQGGRRLNKSSVRVLMVGEKPSIANSIATHISQGPYTSRRGKVTDVHEFEGDFQGMHAHFKVTSVTGHVYNTDFVAGYESWDRTDPAVLFSVGVRKLPSDKRGNICRHLQYEAKGCDIVVLWLDCDREGENICFEVLENVLPNLNKASGQRVFRAKFSSITGVDIRKAMKSLSIPNQHESMAVDARQELDLRMGVAFTRYQSKYFQGKYGNLNSRLISFGPCQTPALGFCVRRHDKIQTFVPEKYWKLGLKFIVSEGNDSGSSTVKLPLEWERGRIFDKEVMAMFFHQIKQFEFGTVVSVTSQNKKKARPLPLNTVELLKVASRQLGIGPASCMRVAESLYMSGYISYPRTETTQYAPSFNIQGILKQHARHGLWGSYVSELLATDSMVRAKRGSDAQDHPPITPTRVAQPGDLGGDQWRIYDYITRRFIATVSPDMTYLRKKAEIQIGTSGSGKGVCINNSVSEVFHVSVNEVIDPGFTSVMPWMKVEETFEYERESSSSSSSSSAVGGAASGAVDDYFDYDRDQEQTVNTTQFDLKEGQKVKLSDCVMNERETSPPGYLTEAELIGQMEKHGIGTDASIPMHIESICTRNFVNVSGGRTLVPTNLGIVLVHGYYKIDPDLCIPQMRSRVENMLNMIAKGEAKYDDVVKHTIEIFFKKFLYFVTKIGKMDSLFENHFSTIENTHGKLLNKCGICKKWMKYIGLKPCRIHCSTCDVTYSLPQNGTIKLYMEKVCPICDFEIVLYSTGGENGISYPLCVYCYNNPPFEDVGKVMGCNNCRHPTCSSATPKTNVCECPESDTCGGELIFEKTSGPNWKLCCNRCNFIYKFAYKAHKVKRLGKICDECEDAHQFKIDFHRDHSPLDDGDTAYTGCLFCDDILSETGESAFGNLRKRRGKGRGRRGGRGGRGRKKMTKMDMLMAHNG